MNILVDTNALLEKHKKVRSSYDKYLLHFIDRFDSNEDEEEVMPPKLRIILDSEGFLKKEYLELAEESLSSGKEELIHVFIQIIETNGLFNEMETENLTYGESVYSFDKTSYNEQLEARILFLAEKEEIPILIPKSISIPKYPRSYFNSLQKLSEKGLEFINSKQLHIQLEIVDNQHPSTIHDLEIILKSKSTKIYDKEKNITIDIPEERESIEFKGVENDYLSEPQLQNAVKGICAMLNNCERGWVFIGITKLGKIVPFTPQYGKNKVAVDSFINCIREEICRITPNPRKYVKTWSIYNENRDKVVIVNYICKNGIIYSYKDKVRIRDGCRSICITSHCL